MNIQEARDKGFTHDAEMYGVPIWYNDETCEVEAKFKIASYWLDFLIWVKCYIGVNEYGFPIKLKERI